MTFDRRSLFTGLFSVLLMVALATPAQAQLPLGQLGVSIGGNVETMDDLDAGTATASFEKQFGFHLGLDYEQSLEDFGLSGPLSSASVRPGLYVRRVGGYSMASDLEDVDETGVRNASLLEGRDFTMWAVEIPLDLKYSFDSADLPVTPYGLLGPQLSILRGEKDFQETLNDASFSINLGAGAEVDLPVFDLTLMPELRYEIGVTDAFQDETEYRLRPFNVSDSPSTGSFQLRVHLFYPL